MVNIAIIGYGKMGKAIEAIARSRGHTIKAIVDPNCESTKKEISAETMKDVDVCIDFTHPSVIMENIRKMSSLGKNMVIGTTGWYDRMEEARKAVEKNKVGLIWSGNFSIGVNAFFRVIKSAAQVFDRIPEYDVLATEFHHSQKADSPSGTANMIGKILIDNIKRKDTLVYDKLDRKIRPNELHIASVRGGSIPGIHTVLFDSMQDTIELTHTVRSREGLAFGAVLAAEFIVKKRGFFGIDDLMESILG